MSIKSFLFNEAKDYLEKGGKHLSEEAHDLSKSANKFLEKNDNAGVVVAAALAGVAVGAALGILFAPDRGSQTRSNIANSVKDFGSTVAEKAKQGSESLANLKDQAVDAIKSKVNAGAPDVANTTATSNTTSPL